MSELYIGVMSGTSLDGVDITLCEISDSKCTLIESKVYKFEQKLKEEILTIISGYTSLEEIGTLNTKLGHLFADSINSFLENKNINAKDIKAIGLHGQTLWHSPHTKYPFSMQLGCPNVVNAKTEICVISDFRSMDIANGGEGAPFAPAFHQFLFASPTKKTVVVNIGGMANISILGDELKGWDIGVGNALLDYWVNECKDLPYDKDGIFAQSGEVNQNLLESLLHDDYFRQSAPKSTGREYFNESWLSSHLPVFKTIKDNDIQRTLLELSAISIADDVKESNSELLIVCGGGAKNKFLMQRIQDLCDIEIKLSNELGIDGDFMESMAFAWLAYKRIHKEEVNLSSVTGAKKNSILGGIYG